MTTDLLRIHALCALAVCTVTACIGDDKDATDTAPTTETADTSTTDTGSPGTCDDSETVAGFYCQQDLCNHCVDDCPTLSESQASLTMCTDTGATTYSCCTVDSCTDPTQGTYDRITCPDAYGATLYWFDPGSGALVGYAWSTDYNGWCDGQAFGEMFGPDLTACE